jgi:hypothetical protein
MPTERVLKIEKMPEEELWTRTLGPYVSLYGKSIEYIEERFGRDAAVDWVKRMERDYREEHASLHLSVANVLERFTPGRALRDKVALLIFRAKVLRTFYEYQFLYNRTEYTAKEVLDDRGRTVGGKMEFRQCPYVAAMRDIPAKVRPRKETFCRYDCQGTFHDEFSAFIGFRIRMEPGRTGCVWHVDAPKDLIADE